MHLDRISIVAVVLGACLVAFFIYHSYQTPHLPVATFDGVPISLEVVTTDAAKELGLGGRANIPENYGMLFVFDTDGYYGFWMKGMVVSIDMFWLDDSGRVVTLKEGVDPSTYPQTIYPSVPARYVLETKAGFGASHGIVEGSMLILQSVPGVSK